MLSDSLKVKPGFFNIDRLKLTFYSIFFLYILEIFTINIRCYYIAFINSICIDKSDWVFVGCCIAQLSVNLFCSCIILFIGPGAQALAEIIWSPKATTFVPLIGIVVANAIEAADGDSGVYILQLLLNFFGYLALLSFYRVLHTNPELLKEKWEIYSLPILHTFFTVSIITCYIVQVFHCGPSNYSILEGLFELFLLGYIWSIINWD